MNRCWLRFGFVVAAGACGLVVTSGCGSGKSTATAEVSGTIKLAGKAPKLDRFEIAFIGGPENKIVTAQVGLDGKYTATGVPVGEVQIGFVYRPPEAVKAAKSRIPIPKGKEMPIVEQTKDPINPVPPHLRDPVTSNLSLTVATGKENTFDFDMPFFKP